MTEEIKLFCNRIIDDLKDNQLRVKEKYKTYNSIIFDSLCDDICRDYQNYAHGECTCLLKLHLISVSEHQELCSRISEVK
jgi:predicted transcriptional regulator